MQKNIPETANLTNLWSSSATVISPPVWHSREPFSLQIETVEAINFSKCWKRSWVLFSFLSIGVESGERQPWPVFFRVSPSQTAIFSFLSALIRWNEAVPYLNPVARSLNPLSLHSRPRAQRFSYPLSGGPMFSRAKAPSAKKSLQFCACEKIRGA